MLGTYYYHEILRKTVVGFGTLFNNIELKRYNAAGDVVEALKVPLSYGPTQKFLARIQQQADLTARDVAITLPRMSFEITGLQYDPSRKASPLKYISADKDANNKTKQYLPVPYNVNFEMSIYAKNQDDGLQIIEQILPYFQPSFNITLKMVPDIDEKRDVAIVLNNIGYRDEYEGDFQKRTVIVWTLQFTAKTYLFGPTSDSSIIRTAIADIYGTTDRATARREITYTVVPKATTDQNNDGVVNAADTALLQDFDDEDFGFSTSVTYNGF